MREIMMCGIQVVVPFRSADVYRAWVNYCKEMGRSSRSGVRILIEEELRRIKVLDKDNNLIEEPTPIDKMPGIKQMTNILPQTTEHNIKHNLDPAIDLSNVDLGNKGPQKTKAELLQEIDRITKNIEQLNAEEAAINAEAKRRAESKGEGA
jgi:hypothetical protein